MVRVLKLNKRAFIISAFAVASLLLVACGGGDTGGTDGTDATDITGGTVAATSGAGTGEMPGTAETDAGATGTDTAGDVTGTDTAGRATGTDTAVGTPSATRTSDVTGGTDITGTPEAMPPSGNTNSAFVASLFTAFAQALTSGSMTEGATADANDVGPYTVFVPTSQAFDQIGEMLQSTGGSTPGSGSTIGDTMTDQATLSQIFAYHVVRGRYTAADLANVSTLTTVNGLTLTVRSEGSTIYINNARVVQADVVVSDLNRGTSGGDTGSGDIGSGGVVYMIDAVLIPPSVGTGTGMGSGTSVDVTDTVTATVAP